MQVFGLPGHIIRSAKAAARIAAQSQDNEAAIRAGKVGRWRQARAERLTRRAGDAARGAQPSAQAAAAVGAPRATLYRGQKRPELRSRRPRRMRARTWTPALVEAVEALRLDHPMWGRAKIGPLLRREGFAVSNATVERIITHLVQREVVERVPTLRRRKGGAASQWKRKHALRLRKANKPTTRP